MHLKDACLTLMIMIRGHISDKACYALPDMCFLSHSIGNSFLWDKKRLISGSFFFASRRPSLYMAINLRRSLSMRRIFFVCMLQVGGFGAFFLISCNLGKDNDAAAKTEITKSFVRNAVSCAAVKVGSLF